VRSSRGKGLRGVSNHCQDRLEEKRGILIPKSRKHHTCLFDKTGESIGGKRRNQIVELGGKKGLGKRKKRKSIMVRL